MKHRRSEAFTIVELLIVIVVIGILAAIVAVSYEGVQDRARATVVISGIKDVENAFGSLASEQGATTWWGDKTFTGNNNPKIPEIIANHTTSDFYKYLQQVPTNTAGMNLVWNYDNDGDNRDPATCDTEWTGVVLAISGMPANISKQVDASMDDGNSNCGRVRYTSNTLIYDLSFTQTMQ